MDAVISFFTARRRTFLGVTAAAASGYALVNYAKRRFDELQVKLSHDRAARDNLRKRFQQNQDDCTFTVQALLPTLASQINAELDLEGTTRALQERTAADRLAAAQALQASTSTLGDSVVRVDAPAAASTEPAPADAEAVAAADATAAESTFQSDAPSVSEPAAPADSISSLAPPLVEPAEAVPTPDSPPMAIADPRSKLELWTEIKLLSVSRTVASIYVLALLVLQTRIQLNVLGRRSYLASVRSLGGRSQAVPVHEDELDAAFANAANFEANGPAVLAQTERDYLTLSWWLLHRGWADVVRRVRDAVADTFGGVALKAALSQADLAGLIERVRRQVEHADASDERPLVPAAIFPSDPADQLEVLTQATGGASTALSPDLQALLDETADLLESPDLARVFRACVDALHAHLLASLDPLFGASAPSGGGGGNDPTDVRFVELQDLKPCRLANLLPAIARQSHLVLDGLSNPYLDTLSEVPDLEAFSAIIYSHTRDLLS